MEAGELGAGGEERPQFSPRPPSWCPRERSRTWGQLSFVLSFCLSFEISLVRFTSSWDRPGRRAKGSYNKPPDRQVEAGV